MSSLKQTSKPSMNDVLNEFKSDVGVSYNCVQIGIIEDFDASNQTATIRIAIKKIISEEADGTKVFKEHPLIMQCPVMTYFGGNSFISCPIESGDNCIVLFCDRDIDEWLYGGGVQAPNSRRIHDINDAIAIVGIRNFQKSISDFLANGIRISFAADSRIDLTEDAIDSIAALFTHDGNMEITGSLTVSGNVYGDGGGALLLDSDLTQTSGKILKAGNGATGTFSTVTVLDGIVTGGS